MHSWLGYHGSDIVSSRASYLEAHDFYCPSLVVLIVITRSRYCLVSALYTYYFHLLQFISNLWGFPNSSTPWCLSVGAGNSTVSKSPPFSSLITFCKFIFIMDSCILIFIFYGSLLALFWCLNCLRFGHWSPVQLASMPSWNVPFIFWALPSFWHRKTTQFYLVPSQTSPWNQPFLLGALVAFGFPRLLISKC